MGVDAEDLTAAVLDGQLDDFTQADLSHADLTGVNLTGVRWSLQATRWPKTMNVGQLLTRSVEIAPGSGIYVVGNPGTATARSPSFA
jgi:hypothetical protein